MYQPSKDKETGVIYHGNDITIEYLYSAGGAKLRQSTYNSGTLSEQLDYSGAFVYDGTGSLKFISTSEGRLIPKSGGGFEYEYFIKDHQPES